MGIFSAIQAEATANIFADPIAGSSQAISTTPPGASLGWYYVTGAVTRVTTAVLFGTKSFDVPAGASLRQQISASATTYTLSCFIKLASLAAVTASNSDAEFDSGASNFDSFTHIGNNWYYCVKSGSATAGTRYFGVTLTTQGWVAGLQLEQKAYATTLAYGSKKGNITRGYYWTGAAHDSTSVRDSQERSGGRVIDLASYFTLEQTAGASSPPSVQSRMKPAQGDGTFAGPAFYDERTLLLTGQIIPTTLSLAGLLSKRKPLYALLKRDAVIPEQPFILRFTGGSTWLESAFFYESGMEGNLVGSDYNEKIPLRLFASDPAWYSLGNDAASLDTQDTLTTNYVLQKGRTGAYSNLATSLNGAVRALAKDSSNNLWLGGDMTSPGTGAVKWNGSSLSAVSGLSASIYALLASGTDVYAAGANNSIAKSAAGAAFSALAIDLGANGPIYVIQTLGSGGGLVYVGGDFTQIGGIAANNVAVYSVAGGTWAALGSGVNGPVYGLRATTTNVYVGGAFEAAGGVANTRAIARWNIAGTSWNAMGTGAQTAGDVVYDIELDGSSNVYAVGYFATMGGVSGANTVAKWNGSVWSVIGSGFALSNAYVIAIDGSNNLYVGGNNIRIGAFSFANLWKWNGSAWATLTGGDLNGTVYALFHDGTDLWIGGAFTQAGAVSSTARFCKHNGSAYSALGSGIDNGIVYSITQRSTSRIVGGSFLNADGQANGDYVIRWDGSAYQVMSTGLTGVVRAMALYNPASEVYIGGEFSGYLTKWDGSAFTTQGTGSAAISTSAAIYALARVGNILYFGGAFATCNSITVNYIFSIDISASNAVATLSSGMDATVYALTADKSGNLYLGGAFTAAGGTTVNYVAKWANGAFSALSGGLAGVVRCLAIDPTSGYLWAGGEGGLLAYFDGANWTTVDTDTLETIYSLAFDDDGTLHIGGSFISLSGLIIDGYGVYSGGTFIPVELDLPIEATVYSLLADTGEITIGFNTAGSTATPGTTSINNTGSGKTYPIITITGPGGLRQLINATTKQKIYFSTATAVSGETLTLDLSPFAKTLVSSISGDISGKILPGQLDTWSLLPGTNSVQLFVDNALATATMEWRLAHEDIAGGE